jgi:hypothetical protein
MNGEQVINNFDQWYPVTLDNFDKQIKLHTSDSVYVFRAEYEKGYTYVTRNIGIWCFVVVFDDLAKAESYKKEHDIDVELVKTAAIDVINEFRSWYFNNVPIFLSALENYMCTSIVTHIDGPLYPSCTSLILVAVNVKAWSEGRLVCLSKNIDNMNAVISASNQYDMIVEVAEHENWNVMQYALAYLPLQVLMNDYDHILIKKNVYELKVAAALSAQSLSLMSEEYIESLKTGENDAL